MAKNIAETSGKGSKARKGGKGGKAGKLGNGVANGANWVEAPRAMPGQAGNPKRERFQDDGPLTARLTRYGALVFSLSAVRRFRLTEARSCRLHFDRSRQMVGIELVESEPDTTPALTSATTSSVAAASNAAAAPVKRKKFGRERNVYSTRRSAHIIMTSVLRSYELDTAAETICPVTLERHGDLDLIAVDLTPAVKAAANGDVVMPFRPGATEWLRYKPSDADQPPNRD